MAFWPKRIGRNSEPVCDPNADPYAVFADVSLSIGGKTILEDVTISLSEQRVGVIGLNGSGKSSFVRLLNGLRLPSSGTLTMFGAAVEDAQKELPKHVGFVFQNPDHQAIFPTVEEEIAFGLTQLGFQKKDSRDRALSFLEQHGCVGLANSPIAELSEGQKQLICILSVLVMEPQLLILDEPMTSLDALATHRIQQMLLSLPQKILMVSHDLSHFEGFDRLIWLESGTLRMDGKPEVVLQAYENWIRQQLSGKAEVRSL